MMESITLSQYLNMNILKKKQVGYGLKAVIGIASLYGIYRLYRYIISKPHKPMNEDDETHSEKQKSTLSLESEHLPYEVIIEDVHREHIGVGTIKHLKYLKDIHYWIILCLMKGSSYQGIVTISFHLDTLNDENQNFRVNFNGAGVKFVKVNSVTMDHRDVKYIDHNILIPKELLKEKAKNSIEIIFENNYSFLNEGLSAYFTIDENHKYSLRQQVIYSTNGYLQIERIIPCINCLNECSVKVETIHPDTFQVFSNSSKSLERFCSVTQYQKYPFLFDLSSNTLNRSFKLNSSTVSSGSGLGDSSSQYSSSNFYNRKKANTQFYPDKLPSIHNFFIFSSMMLELQASSINSLMEQQILVRYFCKHSQEHRVNKNIKKLHNYILDILRRLKEQNVQDYLNKIDILIISDKQVSGYFAPGIILLSQDLLTENSISISCFYLVVRAICGMVKLNKGENILTLAQVLELNSNIFNKFQEFRNFLYLKNQKYERIRQKINNADLQQSLHWNEGYFLKYYSKELKFVIKQSVSHKISFELKNLMLSFSAENLEEYWQNFLSNYNFLSPLITQPLIKLSIGKLGVPSNPKLLQQLKMCFNSSKYILNFYSNEEISDNLPKFMECESHGLESRLTQLKVKQKFKDYITQKYEKYLPIKSNNAEALAIYNQFKKFNETKNFHHISLLKSEVKRVTYFGKEFIKPERVDINCSLKGWKLLQRLKIYPSDNQYFKLMKSFDHIQQF